MKVYEKIVNVHVAGYGWMKKNELTTKGISERKIDMYELSYTDYNDDGEIQSVGTEDFSIERYHAMKLGYYTIVKDSGEKYPSGKTRWDNLGTLSFWANTNDYKKVVKLFKFQFKAEGKALR